MDIRKPIHDKLITDFTAFKYPNNSNTMFASVEKLFYKVPTNTPVCEISSLQTNVIVEGNDFDTRTLTWQAFVYERVQNAATQESVNNMIDRLSYIEDQILDYLQKIPNNIEDAITGIHIIAIDVDQVSYDTLEFKDGVVKTLSITFSTRVNIDVKNL